MVRKLSLSAAIVLSAMIMPVYGQTPAPNTAPNAATTANPELQKQLVPSSPVARRKKWADCNAQADQQKLHFAKRKRFVRQCMKQ
jgi:hypothetical protein